MRFKAGAKEKAKDFKLSLRSFPPLREDGELEDGEIDDEGIGIEEENKEAAEVIDEKEKEREKTKEREEKSHRHSRKRYKKTREKRHSKRRRRDRQKVRCTFTSCVVTWRRRDHVS